MSAMRIASLSSRVSKSYQLKFRSLDDCPHVFEFYSKVRKYLDALKNTKSRSLARFPNLATLEGVNLIVDFTILKIK